MKIPTLVILAIFFTFAISTYAFAQQSDLEASSEVLQSGIISTENKNYIISNELDIRHFFGNQIMRISGTTIEGHFYYIYTKSLEGNINSFGKILVNGKFVPLIFSPVITETEKSTKEAMEKSTIDLLILASIDKISYWKDTVDMDIRVYDSSKNPFKDINYNTGWLDDVSIEVVITHENGEKLATLTGKTGPFGFFTDSYLVRQAVDQTGVITLEVKASYQDSTASKTFESIIFGTPKSPGN